MGEIVRYARGATSAPQEIDGYLNFRHLTNPSTGTHRKLLLEAGVNRVALLDGPDGRRRPAILLRSSPWKAGHETSPWEDVYDLDHGHVRYFGDHKPSTNGQVGATAGNRALLDAWQLHGSPLRRERVLAPPLLMFRAVPVVTSNGTVNKGHLEFCGVGILERLELVIQREPRQGNTFPNLVADVVVLDLRDGDDTIDWCWIDDRRDPTVTADQSLRRAPMAWRRWVDSGAGSIAGVRRSVLSARVKSSDEQRPNRNSDDHSLLEQIYRHFDGQKHAFEHLAATVTAQIFARSGGRYHRGWLTRSGGDGGMDFVGRLDAGNVDTSTPLVVLGQAKCISPGSSVSPDQVARVVARLRRGWIGVFVTTGVFSKRAQIEVIDDEYPVVLVPGKLLVKEVRALAEISHGGDIDAALKAAVSNYQADVTYRRPEEILTLA